MAPCRCWRTKGVLPAIERVGGTSAGAINATLFALGFSIAEQRTILNRLNFKNFMDDNWGVIRDTGRLLNKFGWYKGDFFHEWMSKHIEKKLGDANATFKHLKEAKKPDLYVYGTSPFKVVCHLLLFARILAVETWGVFLQLFRFGCGFFGPRGCF